MQHGPQFNTSFTSFTSDVFVCDTVHDSTGARVACGALQEVLTSSFRIYATTTAPLDDRGVTGSFTAYLGAGFQDNICIYGTISGLEPNLVSFRSAETGPDCTATYGK